MVLTWAGGALVVGAAGIALRWMSARTDSLGRPRPFPYVSVVVVSPLGLAAIALFVIRVRLESRLATAASELVGAGVEVRCQSFGGAFLDVGADLGYVAYGADGYPSGGHSSSVSNVGICPTILGPTKSTRRANRSSRSTSSPTRRFT